MEAGGTTLQPDSPKYQKPLMLNKDLDPLTNNQEIPSKKPQQFIIKHTEVVGGGGFFETQVDLIEKELKVDVP